ncbi:MAG: metal-dependent hydrolase [Acidobacteriota bacterium]
MPTIVSHPAVAIGLRRWFGRVPGEVLAAGVITSILPDVDVLGLFAGIDYGSTFGHRGFTHSIVFAMLAGIAGVLVLRNRGNDRTDSHDPPMRTSAMFAFLFLTTLSHPLLDAMTNGGRGIAFFSPFSNHRYFFPWHPIPVSPIGRLDLSVVQAEILWVWLPCLVLAAIGAIFRSLKR